MKPNQSERIGICSQFTEKYLQLIASFMIVLVLTIPFYTTSVYAGISKVTVKGSDGIDGFAKVDDSLNFDAQGALANETVTNDNFLLGSGIKFGTCVSISNGSQCTLKFPGNGTQPFEAKLIPFTINLFRGSGALDDSKQGNVTIDNKAPQVKLSFKQQKFSSQNNGIVINFDVTDFACDDPSCANTCVGIKTIDLFTLDGAFRQTIEPGTSDCNFKSNISIDPATFSNGKNSVFAVATDKFNQASPATSVTFDVSANPPGIIPDSFAITRKGISLSTFSSNKVPVVVAVNISGDLNLNSVTADLSSLNPDSNLKNTKASCFAVENGTSTCTWNIGLNPGLGGVKNIAVNASDNSGNKASAVISRQLALDDKGPVVLSLSSNTASSQSLVKSGGNTVIAVFDEATGLSADDAFLHVNDRTKLKATSCNKDSNWICVWNDVDFGGTSEISIESDTTDILGNFVSQDTYVGITVDNKAPVLRSINITPIGGLVQAFPGFFKIGDKIAVVANVTEDNDVIAVADFSRFISGASRVQGSCEKVQDDQNICTWLTDSVNLQNSDVVTFNFSDNAGNTLIITKSLKTFGLENATVPDFWKNTVACSPSAIDRSLGPLINQRVFCLVTLAPRSFAKPVSTVFISPASCSGDSSVVDSVETFNTAPGSTSPVVKITLKKDDFKINNATLQCSLNIFSKIGSSTTITKNPEIENVNIPIPFFNLPLGELGDAVQHKIDQAKKDAEGILDIIGTLNKIVFYAKKICQIISILYNILGVLYFVYGILKGTEVICTATVFGDLFGACTAIQQSATGVCVTQEAGSKSTDIVKKYSDKFCAYVNCKETILWGPYVQKFINDPSQYLGKAGYLFSPGQYLGSKTDGTNSVFDHIKQISVGTGGKPRPVSEYMDPNHNLIVATLFACLPGIIYGLDKYRQIQCLYADCLQNAVGQQGLPITACEDQKSYATCKYITGEIFALFPWTAVFDHFISIIKNALSNPFSTIGVALSLYCGNYCNIPKDGGVAFQLCRGARLFTLIGNAAQNVKDIVDTGFTIRTDYCDRLKTKKTTPASSVTTLTSSGSGVTNTTKKK